MPLSRYQKYPFIQPTRKYIPQPTDILHTFKHFDTIDILANKYYGDPTLGWIIMLGNPSQFMEFMVPVGTVVRIPYPLDKVLAQWGIKSEI